MLELTGNINFKTIVCTVDGLRSYVVFRSIDDIGLISRSLCNINESAIPDLVDMLQNQIDVAKIMRIVSKTKCIYQYTDNSAYLQYNYGI